MKTFPRQVSRKLILENLKSFYWKSASVEPYTFISYDKYFFPDEKPKTFRFRNGFNERQRGIWILNKSFAAIISTRQRCYFVRPTIVCQRFTNVPWQFDDPRLIDQFVETILLKKKRSIIVSLLFLKIVKVSNCFFLYFRCSKRRRLKTQETVYKRTTIKSNRIVFFLTITTSRSRNYNHNLWSSLRSSNAYDFECFFFFFVFAQLQLIIPERDINPIHEV